MSNRSRPRLSDVAYARILQILFEQRLLAGAYVSQSDLVELTGVPVGPLRIRITNFTLRTQSGCHNRTHQLKVHLNGDAVFQGAMRDCLNLTLRSDRSWRGVLQLAFNATGFDPGERVHGSGDVEFVLALL